MTAPVRTVVICGRDAALWLTANALLRALGPAGVTIEVVELPSLVQTQDVYASLPALEAFHRLLGIDEHDLLKRTRGSFTLGQQFHNFSGTAAPFFHAYGSHGISINHVPFVQYLTKARGLGLNVAYEDFSLTAAAAKQGRFVVPDEATRNFARTDYGYHLPAQTYVAALKLHAVTAGVKIHTARIVSVALDPHSGDIAALEFGAQRIVGDLFIDATGTQAQLLRGALKVGFESWRAQFSGDRVLTAAGERLKALPPYSQVRALEKGWLGLFAAQDATRLSLVYDSRELTDAQALETAAIIAGLKLGDALVSPLEPGRSAAAWVKNCVAIGGAACVLDPMDNVDLQAMQQGIVHLLALFPLDCHTQPERGEYNRLMRMGFERLRDFQLIHSVCNGNYSSRFWERARNIPVPDGLRTRMAAWQSSGHVPLFDEDAFPEDSWNAVFLGHGLKPQAYEALADVTDDQGLAAQFKRILGFVRERVEQMHGHDAYLEVFCSGDQ